MSRVPYHTKRRFIIFVFYSKIIENKEKNSNFLMDFGSDDGCDSWKEGLTIVKSSSKNRMQISMVENHDEECDNYVFYKLNKREIEVPFVIYADFECILENFDTCLPDPNTRSPSTTTISKHVPCAFSYFIKCSFDHHLNDLKVYKGIDAPEQFVLSLTKDVKYLYKNFIMKPKPMNPSTDLEKRHQSDSIICHICKERLDSERVADHCHLTGQYRGPAHSHCNINYVVPKCNNNNNNSINGTNTVHIHINVRATVTFIEQRGRGFM